MLDILLLESSDQQSNMYQVVAILMLRRKRLKDVLDREVQITRFGGELVWRDIEAMVISWPVRGDVF